MRPTFRTQQPHRFACAIAAWALVALALPGAPSLAQIGDLRLPISLDADSTDYDGKSSMLMFEGLRLSQGSIGVQADKGLASKLDFEDSVWKFSGNVIIDTENGRIRCDTADLKFTGHRLQLASITGSPAVFDLQRNNSDEQTHAEAGRLDYDFDAGIIEFSENAVISEGGNQISSNYLVYNISEQRINAQSAGEGERRVKITYTPRPADPPEGDARQDGSENTDDGAPPDDAGDGDT